MAMWIPSDKLADENKESKPQKKSMRWSDQQGSPVQVHCNNLLCGIRKGGFCVQL